MSIRRRTGTAAAVLLAVLAPAGAAQAKSHTTTDPAHDVVRVDDLFGDGDSDGAVDATRSDGDLTSMRVVHGPHRVRLTLHFAALTHATKSKIVFYELALRTNEHRRYDLTLLDQSAAPGVQRDFSRGNGSGVRCRGLHAGVSYTARTVTASIPRSCLSDPRWVRVGGAVGSIEGDLSSEDGAVTGYFDDVSSAGGLGDDLVLGPRVRRG